MYIVDDIPMDYHKYELLVWLFCWNAHKILFNQIAMTAESNLNHINMEIRKKAFLDEVISVATCSST
jgi:hypothetical protein